MTIRSGLVISTQRSKSEQAGDYRAAGVVDIATTRRIGWGWSLEVGVR